MNKKFALYALPIFAVVAILGIGFVSAHDSDDEGHMLRWFKLGGEDKLSQEQMMEKKAEMLGIDLLTLQEVMVAIEEGETTWDDFLESEGIDSEALWAQKMEQKRVGIQERLDQLVASGELTQEEADAKLAGMQIQFENREFDSRHEFFKQGWFHNRGEPCEN